MHAKFQVFVMYALGKKLVSLTFTFEIDCTIPFAW